MKRKLLRTSLKSSFKTAICYFIYLLRFAKSGRVTATVHEANYCGPVTVPPPWEIDQHTGVYVPYSGFTSLRTVCGFFNVLQNLYGQRLWDRAYGLSSERTRKSKFADVITKAALSTQLFKNPECWSGRGLNSNWANRTVYKGLFTWSWVTPGRWGNPLSWGNSPFHIISHFNLITLTW